MVSTAINGHNFSNCNGILAIDEIVERKQKVFSFLENENYGKCARLLKKWSFCEKKQIVSFQVNLKPSVKPFDESLSKNKQSGSVSSN